MSLKTKAIKGLFWTLIHQFGYQGINFIVQVFLARMLLPEAFGLIALLQVFVAIGTNLVDSGLASSLIRSNDIDEEDYSTVFYLNICMAILLYFIMFSIAPNIASFYEMPILVNVIKIYCLSFIINSFSIVQITKLTREMKFKIQLLIQLPSLIISGIISVILAHKGWGIWSIVAYNILQNSLITIFYWIKSDWRPRWQFNFQKLKYHLNFGYKLSLASLLNSVFDNAYSLVIGKTFSPQTLGYYNRAEMFQLFPSKNISTAVEKVTYPMFARIQDDNKKLKQYYSKIFYIVVFFLTPTMVLLGVVAEPLFSILLTDKWLPMVPYFQILTIVGILHPFQRYNLNILRVKGRSDLVLKLNVIRKIVLVILLIVGVKFGMLGILISQCIYAVICVFLNTMYSSQMINYSLREQIKDVSGIYVITGICCILIYCIDRYIVYHFSDWWRVLIGILSGYALYFGFAILFRFKILNIVSEFKDNN